MPEGHKEPTAPCEDPVSTIYGIGSAEELRSVFSSLAQLPDTTLEDAKIQEILTRIPAIGPENDGSGEDVKAAEVVTLLKKIGVDELTMLNAPDHRVPAGYRPNIIAKIKGDSSRKTLWIMSHLDVVPAGDSSLWDTDPFTTVVKEGKIFGRGTEDDQQGIVSSLLLFMAIREEKLKPPFDIGLAIVADEEAGSEYGIQYVLNEKPDLFSRNDLIIIPDAGNEDGTMIEVAEKSILWIKASVKGRQTHGSTPEKGINSHSAAARLILRMESLYQDFDQSDPVYDPPISTFAPTKTETNVDNINTIPGNHNIYFDCRILPGYDLAGIKSAIRKYADEIEAETGTEITLTYVQDVPAPEPTPVDTPAALALQKAVKDVLHRDARPMGIGGGTVAAYFREHGLPAVCWCTVDDTLHGPNEYCLISNVLNDAKVFAHVAFNIDPGPSDS